jgi:hypothetical protein
MNSLMMPMMTMTSLSKVAIVILVIDEVTFVLQDSLRE